MQFIKGIDKELDWFVPVGMQLGMSFSLYVPLTYPFEFEFME